MSHRHTVIEPSPGLTVLVGPNNCGKSAVITALQILAHNENSTYVTRHGEKQCSVKVHTEDGHEIIWQRRNNSTSYTIDGQLYDRLRNAVPDELKSVLRLPKVELNTSNEQIDIHFGMQKQPVFLLNETGRTAAGFFAASSDASRLIEMQKVHKDRVRTKKQDAKRLESECEELQDEVDKLQSVADLAEMLKECERDKLQLDAAEQATMLLRTMIGKVKKLSGELVVFEQHEHQLKDLPELPILESTNKIESTIAKIRTRQQQVDRLSLIAENAQMLVGPPDLENVETLRSTVDEIQVIKQRLHRAQREFDSLQTLPAMPELSDVAVAGKLCDESLTVVQRLSRLEQESRELADKMDLAESDIKNFVDANATCPTCQQPLDKNAVLRQLKYSGGRDEI